MTQRDLSRFGRNYKETGNYLERVFPFLDVRFIAVNDNFDTLTAERTADGYIVPLKNIMKAIRCLGRGNMKFYRVNETCWGYAWL